MFSMAVGHSDDVDPADAVRAAIDQCRDQLDGATPAAGLLFVAFDVFDPLIPAAVRAAFAGIQLAGATSAAEMSSIGGYTEDGVTLAVFASDNVDVSTGVGAHADEDVDMASRAAVEQALRTTTKEPRLCIMLADPLAAQSALAAVQRALPEGVVLVGGASSGANLSVTRPNYEFSNDEVVQDGVVLLLFSGPLAFSVAVGTGLHPVGPRGVVTDSAYGQVIAIDNRPAIEFVAPYVSEPGPATFGNPLSFRESGSDVSYLRAMIGSDSATGAILIPGDIPVGAQVQLTTATTDEVVRATGDVVRRASDAFPAGATPTAALVFSCAVRKFMLGTRTSQEVAEARSLLPPTMPVAGMYCVGEIAPDGGEASRFHNETFVTLLLGA